MQAKRGPYQSDRQRQRRQRILRAASLELQHHGLSQLTMRSVAEASDVSLKTLYNIFGNRDLLLLRVATEGLSRLPYSAAIARSNKGIPRLLAYAEGAMRMFAKEPEFSSLVVGILLRVQDKQSTVDDLITQVRGLIHRCIVEAVEMGELPEHTDTEALADMLCAHQWGLVLMWERDIMTLETLSLQLTISYCLTLMSLCEPQCQTWLQARHQEFKTRLDSLTEISEEQLIA